ncbi:hypothetical protein B0H13DRAFT_1934573 [Mycena leptocephala]|nr:hypothetical protein B0H13DRAFT_1934573 [Mycena leptocephala]
MVVFVVCSAQLIAISPATNSLPTNTLTLDAMTFLVLSGSPDSDTYNASVVLPQTLDDGHGSRAVTIAVSDFVCGETKASTVQLIFDFSTARWTRAPVPQPNTAIQFYGLCRELSPTGILRLKVDSTALNFPSNALAPSDDTSGSAGSTASAPVTPSRRRKFDPTSPPSVDSPDSPFASSTSTLSANVTTLPRYQSLIRMHELGLCTIPDCSNNILNTCHRPQLSHDTNVSNTLFFNPVNSDNLPSTLPRRIHERTSQSNTPTSVQPSSSSATVPAAHSIQSNPQPAKPSGSTSTGSSAGVSTSSTVQGPDLWPRK